LKKNNISTFAVDAQPNGRKFITKIGESKGGSVITFSKMTSSIVDTFMGLCYREAAEANFDANKVEINERMNKLSRTSSAQLIMPVELTAQALKLVDSELLEIHNAIHQESITSVTIRGDVHQIRSKDTGCRFVQVGEVTFIEQNKKKNSKYGRMALEGHALTWIVKMGRWGLIIDKDIKRR